MLRDIDLHSLEVLFRLFYESNINLVASSLSQDINRDNHRYYTSLPSVRRIIDEDIHTQPEELMLPHGNLAGGERVPAEEYYEHESLNNMDEEIIRDVVTIALYTYPHEFINESFWYSFLWGEVDYDTSPGIMSEVEISSIEEDMLDLYLDASPIKLPYLIIVESLGFT